METITTLQIVIFAVMLIIIIIIILLYTKDQYNGIGHVTKYKFINILIIYEIKWKILGIPPHNNNIVLHKALL